MSEATTWRFFRDGEPAHIVEAGPVMLLTLCGLSFNDLADPSGGGVGQKAQ
jgi:hypothetical protein